MSEKRNNCLTVLAPTLSACRLWRPGLHFSCCTFCRPTLSKDILSRSTDCRIYCFHQKACAMSCAPCFCCEVSHSGTNLCFKTCFSLHFHRPALRISTRVSCFHEIENGKDARSNCSHCPLPVPVRAATCLGSCFRRSPSIATILLASRFRGILYLMLYPPRPEAPGV